MAGSENSDGQDKDPVLMEPAVQCYPVGFLRRQPVASPNNLDRPNMFQTPQKC